MKKEPCEIEVIRKQNQAKLHDSIVRKTPCLRAKGVKHQEVSGANGVTKMIRAPGCSPSGTWGVQEPQKSEGIGVILLSFSKKL